jgi:hypothetical protein
MPGTLSLKEIGVTDGVFDPRLGDTTAFDLKLRMFVIADHRGSYTACGERD